MTTTDPQPIDLGDLDDVHESGCSSVPTPGYYTFPCDCRGPALVAEVGRLRDALNAIRTVVGEHVGEGDAPNCAAHYEGLYCCMDAEHSRGAAMRAALDS